MGFTRGYQARCDKCGECSFLEDFKPVNSPILTEECNEEINKKQAKEKLTDWLFDVTAGERGKKDLCPACAVRYSELINSFFQEKKKIRKYTEECKETV